MSNIILNTLTYVGEGLANGVSRFVNRAAGLYAGFSAALGRVTSSQKKVTVRWNFTVPVLITGDTACGCDGEVRYITYVETTVRFDQAASAAHREDVYLRLKDLVGSVPYATSVKDLSIIP